MWAQNSTAIPVAMTKLTRETAFSEMSQTTITPMRLIIIKEMVMATHTPAAAPSSGLIFLNFTFFENLTHGDLKSGDLQLTSVLVPYIQACAKTMKFLL